MSLPPNKNLLALHPNHYYVESGIFHGDSLRLAIDTGFKVVIGVEYFPQFISSVQSRFRMGSAMEKQIEKTYVKLYQGDSGEILSEAMKMIDKPATLFLDGHSQFIEGEEESPTPYPLEAELLQIAKHSIRTHTLIVDDILHLTHPDVPSNLTRKGIENLIWNINPQYKIRYVSNPVRENLLIATI